jgi:hypothetical protein
MPRSYLLIATTTLAFVLVSAPPVFAADQATGPAADPEEQLDDGLKKFGYLTGLATGCVKPEQKADLEREALDLSDGIGRLLGTDRAFFYAAAFGYGTSVTLETQDCEAVLKRYEERVEKFRAGRGGAK